MFQSFVKRATGENSEKEAQSTATGYSDRPESPVSAEQALQDKIIALWKVVWQGLYQIHDRDGPFHATRLKEHYFAAGMSALHLIESDDNRSALRRNCPHGVLGLLGQALSQSGPKQLRLFHGLSVSSLESVVTLLEAYESQIPAMNEIYTVLRKLEVGFRTPTTEDEQAVKEQFLPLADALAKHLLHLDARLDVLVSKLADENWERHGDSLEHRSWLVYDKVFPYKHRGKTSFSSKKIA